MSMAGLPVCLKPRRSVELADLGSFVVLSDLHLRQPYDDHAQQTMRALAALPVVDTVFFLGDVFDFFYAGSFYFEKIWHEFFAIIDGMRERGCRIIFLEGNHDYGFEYYTRPLIRERFLICGDAEVIAPKTRWGRIHFLHGDTIMYNQGYVYLRQLTKSKVFQSIARYIPGSVMHFLFNGWAHHSRQIRQGYAFAAGRFSQCLARNGDLSEADVLILGHLHAELDSVMGSIRVLCGGDWRRMPNILVGEREGDFRRLWWSESQGCSGKWSERSDRALIQDCPQT